MVTSLLNKHGLDKDLPSNYHSISNLNNISKFLEHLILNCIRDHISSSNFNSFKSAYRKFYSIKTALLVALDHTYHFIDQGSTLVQLLILQTMTSSSIDYKPASKFMVLLWHGSALIFLSQASLSTFRLKGHPLLTIPLMFCKGLFMDLFSSPFLSLPLPTASYGLEQQQYANDRQLYVPI